MPDLSAAGLAPLERALGHRFADRTLLQAALIHTSFVNERPDRNLQSNERLEFLGDAVLGMIAAHRLYERRPDSHEGELTVMRAWLVRQSTLARWARQVNLGQYIHLGRGEVRGGGRDRPAILARTLEAVMGAIYLDGGLEATRDVVLPFLDRDVETGFTPQRTVDAKSRLQQVTQARFGSMPQYRELEHTGPGHSPIYVFEVQSGPEVLTRGSGPSKRAAQQAAAHATLARLDVDEEEYELPPDGSEPVPA